MKAKTRYPTHLYFDASQSAMAKFFGDKIANVDIHSSMGLCQVLSVCPESIGLLGIKCRACLEGKPSKPRLVALAWDVHKNRWCVYLSSPKTFESILSAAKCASKLAFGKAPVMILQREDNETMVEAIEQDAVTKGIRPELEDFLRGMEARSYWATGKEKFHART